MLEMSIKIGGAVVCAVVVALLAWFFESIVSRLFPPFERLSDQEYQILRQRYRALSSGVAVIMIFIMLFCGLLWYFVMVRSNRVGVFSAEGKYCYQI